MFITEANPQTIANLWTRARAMFTRAVDIVGPLQTLARLAALARFRRRDIAAAIARLESVVRKIIFIEAAELLRAEAAAARTPSGPRLEVVTQPAPSQRPRAARQAASRAPFNPSEPESWRVRLKFALPRDPHACPESRAPRIRALWGPTPKAPVRPPHKPRHPVPAPLCLALRFEALRRAIEDPAPYVRRLARLFPRLSRRYPRAAERYAVAAARPHRSDPGDPGLIVETMALALFAATVFLNSS